MPQSTVRFYELLTKDDCQFPDIDIEALLDKVANMPDREAYVKLARMELLGSIHSPQVGRAPQCPLIILDRITRHVMMRIESQREYRPLVLGENDTIAEPTHVGLFPGNVLGIMRQSGQAPGPSSVRDFINTASLFDEEIAVRPLVDGNALRALADVGTMTRLNLELDPDAASKVTGGAKFLADIMELFRRNLPGVSVGLDLKLSARGPEEVSQKAYDAVTELHQKNALGAAQRAQIGYRRLEDGRADSYDFLSESVSQAVEVELDEERGGPNNARASEAIMDAYNSQYDDIRSALNRPGAMRSAA